MDPDIKKQTGSTDYEINLKRNLSLEKRHGQEKSKKHVALHLIEWIFNLLKYGIP